MSFILLGILNAQAEAGAVGDYELLETTILGSSQSSVTFDNLDTVAADYKHLQLRIVSRGDRNDNNDFIRVNFNSDTTTSYHEHRLAGDGSSVGSFNFINKTAINLISFPASLETANEFGAGVMDILDFADSSKNTTTRTLMGYPSRSIVLTSGLFAKTNAVTSIELSLNVGPNFVTGSRFSLYGIKAA